MEREPYQLLETEWAKAQTLRPEGMVACNSGTAALHLALEALRLPEGSGVILPDYTMVACANAVVMAGLEPIFCDCRRDSLLIDTTKLDSLMNGDVRAIMAVHVYGRQCDMQSIHAFADTYGLNVIEDLAEAHSVRPHWRTDVSCWSFYKNKVVHGEEGGAAYFKNVMDARVARQLRSVGFTEAHDYTHIPRGHNYRLANLLAEPIRESIHQMGYNLAERRRVEALFEAECPNQWKQPHRDCPWVYDIRIPGMNHTTQTELVRRLNSLGFTARHGFKPMTDQQQYRFMTHKMLTVESHKASSEVVYLNLTPDWQNPHDEMSANLLFKEIKKVAG